MKGLLLMLVSLYCFNVNINAQEKHNKTLVKDKSDKIENIVSLKSDIDSLYREILLRDSIINVKEVLIDSLRKNIEKDSLRIIDAANRQQDSLLNVVDDKEREITILKSNVGFVDTCMVKLANRWLYERFNKSDVEEAIMYFDRIYSSRLKEEMSIVQELLRNYEQSYKEFQSILKEAQYDIDRENPFACKEYTSKYRRKIENTSYFLKYYNGDWNIRYLNDLMKEALERLHNHSSDKYADFTTLMDSDSWI